MGFINMEGNTEASMFIIKVFAQIVKRRFEKVSFDYSPPTTWHSIQGPYRAFESLKT